MGQRLTDIAKELQKSDKKVQLIYAFNGSGKTRLSRECKELIAPKGAGEAEGGEEEPDSPRSKILYYNAFTEDLFYWNNDLKKDLAPKLVIQPNTFTRWALVEQGQDQNVITNFQRYTNDKLTPTFKEDFSEVMFSLQRGNEEPENHIKLSRGEESNFIWSVFFTILDQVVQTLAVYEDDRDTDQFNELQYIFIDDPVSSLDENHLIRLAVDIAALVKRSQFFELKGLRFIITTHNPLFYNVLANELGRDDKEAGWKSKQLIKRQLVKFEDGTFSLTNQAEDSHFSYHLFLKAELHNAIESGQLHKYHFNFLRNILEKTSTFLGYKNWQDLLPTKHGTSQAYANRIINLGSHSKHAADEVRDLDEEDKRVLKFLANNINEEGRFHFEREGAKAARLAGDEA